MVKEVIWYPPISNWMKVNTDGSLLKNPTRAACGGIFRNSFGFTMGCFAQKIFTDSAFVAEIFGAILAIEIASHNNWLNLWLETDSMLLVMAFNAAQMIPCKLRNGWAGCMDIAKGMNLLVSHIYREGNSCADSLASLGLDCNEFVWWNHPPSAISSEVIRNMLGLPNFRFTSF
jgi:ribonuclease HI